MTQKLDRHLYKIDKIVVGSCLSSALYCLQNNVPMVFIEEQKPFLFDDIDLHLSPWSPIHGSMMPQVHLWEQLMFYLGLRGNIFGTDLCRSIRLEPPSTPG